MLIRTQNRKRLIDTKGMEIYYSKQISDRRGHILQNAQHEIHMCSNHSSSTYYIILGTYSTEEKAMEVLDMIQEEYEGANFQYVHNTVFEMPADEDVEVNV